MQTKLTLRMDEQLISSAKDFAEEQGKWLSRLVADYFAFLVNKKHIKTKLSPSVKVLSGTLKGIDLDKKDYKKHLEKKHL